MCLLQVSTKTPVLVTCQMLFLFPNAERLGQAVDVQGWGVHPPHLHCVDFLPLLGMWKGGNPVRPEKLLIIGEGEHDKVTAHGFVV